MSAFAPVSVILQPAPDEDFSAVSDFEARCARLLGQSASVSRPDATTYDGILAPALVQQLLGAVKPSLSELLTIAAASGIGAVVITAIREWGASHRGRHWSIKVGDVQVDCSQSTSEECERLLRAALAAKRALDNDAIRMLIDKGR